MIYIPTQITVTNISSIGRFMSEDDKLMATFRNIRQNPTSNQATRIREAISLIQMKLVKDFLITVTDRLEKVT